ncbi:hypothetical protein AOQ71_20105 [Bradyrhizobium manausense]|uniref:Uncharacterized protein n=1 Tax=Bradyrhizobium manausense TaxID=989370 RepID=A0A0R3DK53_9BRAD|nr:hypothetical protein AOQ71_20105 [Bradyrhizobium manausense]
MALSGGDRQGALACESILRLSPRGVGGAVDAERGDIKNGEQVEPMQFGRQLQPRFARVATQMTRRRRAFLGASRLRRDPGAALAGVALGQVEMWMFRRRTGHDRLLFQSRTQESTTG